MITWVVDHAKEPLAPHSETAKKYAEAERLLKEVIARHPRTPWADLAQDALNRGFSVRFNEWHHNPKYYDRVQFVPKQSDRVCFRSSSEPPKGAPGQ